MQFYTNFHSKLDNMTKNFGDQNDAKCDSYSHTNQGFSSFLAQKPKSDCLNSSLSILDENWC
jgi:hypothetical protein